MQCFSDYQAALRTARQNYFSNVIAQKCNDPKALYTTINTLLKPTGCSALTPLETCDRFQTCFIEKVIRSSLPLLPVETVLMTASVKSFDFFEQVSVAQVKDIIIHLKRTSDVCNVTPLCLLKESVDVVGPSIAYIINSSLQNGIVPTAFKQAVIQPLLKKHNLDSFDLQNYRPISKLSCLSKVLEKVVYAQLMLFLSKHEILDKFQSGFRAGYSTPESC